MSLEIEVSVPAPPAITVTVEPGGAQGPQGPQGEVGPAGEIDPVELEAAIEDYLTENPPTSSAAWGAITGTLASQADLKAALDAKSAVGHTHAQSDVTGLTAALTAKADASAVTTALAGKSDTGHSHAQSDVTGLTAALAAKADDAATTTALAGKAATSHTHTASNVTDFNSAADARVAAGIIVAGTANNPHTTEGAARNASLPKNFWQYTGTAGVNDPDNWIAGDEWISA
jgi:hypothetical protein